MSFSACADWIDSVVQQRQRRPVVRQCEHTAVLTEADQCCGELVLGSGQARGLGAFREVALAAVVPSRRSGEFLLVVHQQQIALQLGGGVLESLRLPDPPVLRALDQRMRAQKRSSFGRGVPAEPARIRSPLPNREGWFQSALAALSARPLEVDHLGIREPG